jgi:hypothetical protein
MPSHLGFFGPESLYDSSQINMYLGDDPRPSPSPVSGLVYDGYTRGPESLLWLEGKIPDRHGNYHERPLGPQKESPIEDQLRQEYMEYMNSLGNPLRVENDYFYWRAKRLAEIPVSEGGGALPAGNKSIFSLGPESFIQMDAVTEFQRRQEPSVIGGISISPNAIQNRKITAMAHQLAGVPQIVGGGQLNDLGQRLVSDAMGKILAMIQQKMNDGQSYDEAVESVYRDQGAPMIAPVGGDGGLDDDTDKGPTGGYIPPRYRYCPVP